MQTVQIIFGSSITFLVFIAVILGIYYFFSRKNMKHQQQYFEKLHSELKVGKRVLAANGIYGAVKKIENDQIELEIAKGLNITVSRYGISEIL